MIPNGKSAGVKVLVGVVGAVIIGLITMVVASQSRITAVEVRVQDIKAQMETNRIENRQEHQAIKDKLDEIAKDVRK